MNKLRGGGDLPPKAKWFHLLKAFAGGFLGIYILGYLGQSTEAVWVMAPFGATCVLLFGVPTSPFAQPRNILGGYMIAATIGLVLLHVLGNSIFVMALAVGLALVLMQVFRVVHPPAGAMSFIILAEQGEIGFDFLITPVLIGSLVLVALALIINNLGKGAGWPMYWRGNSSEK